MAALDGAFQGASSPAVEFRQGPHALPSSSSSSAFQPAALGRGDCYHQPALRSVLRKGSDREGLVMASGGGGGGGGGCCPDGLLAGVAADPAQVGRQPPLLSQKTQTRAVVCGRRKHKLEEAPDNCPASKKRLTDAMLSPTSPSGLEWMLCGGQPAGRGAPNQCINRLPCTPDVLEMPCEEMEQAMGEQACEDARRKLQEMEDRLIDEDEDVPVEGNGSSLPTLVLSDALKTGLKRAYEGALTQKMIESMSRPSMELVLWKPLPALFTEKAKAAPLSKNYKSLPDRGPPEPAGLPAAFCPALGKSSEGQPAAMPAALYVAPAAGQGAEEEMEL